jgi:hypothetical protein
MPRKIRLSLRLASYAWARFKHLLEVVQYDVVKSAKAGLREQEVRRTEIPRAERRPVVQAKRSGEQLLASN